MLRLNRRACLVISYQKILLFVRSLICFLFVTYSVVTLNNIIFSLKLKSFRHNEVLK